MGGDRDIDEFLREVGELDVLSAVPGALAPVEPPPALRDRLLASIVDQGRFERFAVELGRLMDVGLESAGALLDGIAEASRWQPGPLAGITLLHIEGGAAVRDAVTGFVRIEAGTAFPEHTHLGDETVMVLQGSYEDGVSGAVFRPGAVVRLGAQTTHSIIARPGPALLYLAIVHVGVEIGGEVMLAGDPRI